MGLEDDLRSMLATRAGTWGVYARHLGTGETVAIRADAVMPAQSSVKVCVLLAYTKKIRLGEDERDRRVTLRGEDHEMGSGILRFLAPGLLPTLDDLAWLMIVLSDNVATQALIRELGGREVVNADMDALGLSNLRLNDSLQQGASYFTATPHDLAEVYTHLDDHAREILYRVDKVDFLPRRIPHISRSPVVSVGQSRPGRRGGCEPRASIARATSGSYPWNPNAMRVRSLILVFVDSTSPWERPVSSATSIASRWVAMRRWSCTNAGIRDRRAQLAHRSSACLPSSPLTANT